ncbi:MAG: C-GCAxxG-C-C family protein [candidate division Zixibacteria bacterium]|nr:C-GCAxxG-C-C family protein [candidate division Zixibacteria bacterium]
MSDSIAVTNARMRAEEMYRSGEFLCSEAVFIVANEFLGQPVPKEMVKLASGFPVGMGCAGCVCGALAGGVMALGLKFGRTTPGAETPGMFEASKELHERFKQRRKSVCCRVLIKKFEFGSPEHIDQCITITGEVAADVIRILEDDSRTKRP